MPPAPLFALGLAAASLVAAPLSYLVLRALPALGEAALGGGELALFLRTLGLVAAVVPTAFLLALPLAALAAFTDFRPRGLLALVGLLPLALPPYVLAYAWLAATGPGGLFGAWLPRLEGFWGAWWVLSVYTAPYFFLALQSAFARLSPAPLEAARTLGVGLFEAFFRVVLPLLAPAVWAGALVVALHVLGDFGVVGLMRYETLSYALYYAYETAYDRAQAARYALWLLVLAAVLLGFDARLRRRQAPPEQRGQIRFPLGPLRVAAWVYLGSFFAAGLGVPLAVLLAWAGEGFGRVGFPLEALGRTLLAAAPAAALAAGLAAGLVYLAVRFPRYALFERVAFLGYAVPPTALGLALVFLALYGIPALYQTLALLVYGYLVHFLAEAMGPVRAALGLVPRGLEEAARTLGESAFGAFRRVVWPLFRGGVLSGGLLVFLGAMKELPLTLMLAPIGYETLAVATWTYAAEGFLVEAAPFALVLSGLGGAAALFLYGTRGWR